MNPTHREDSNTQIMGVFSKLSIELYLLLAFVFGVSILNLFNLYRWHFGNLIYAIKRDGENLSIRPNSEDLVDSITSMKGLLDQTEVADIPLIGMKVFITDYTHLLIIVSFLVFYWLYRRLSFTKNMLSNYLNYFNSFESDDKAIFNLFFIILPSVGRPNRYVEAVVKVFISVLYIIVISNFYDVFIAERRYGERMYNEEGFTDFLPHLLIVHIVLLAIIFLSHILYNKLKKELLHIRNLLVIIRWNDYAFFPALYEAFETKRPLEHKRNYIEYRQYGEDDDMQLIITVKRLDTTFKMVMKDHINMIKQLNLYLPSYRKELTEKVTYERPKYIDRDLTAEEDMMKRFFKKLITDNSISNNELARDYAAVLGADSNREISMIEVKNLIAKDDIIEAFDAMLAVIRKENDIKFENDVIVLSREYTDLTKKFINGILSVPELTQEKNRINLRFLEIIKYYEK